MNGSSSGPARLQAWERDVINRQRNIVFPDTVLNDGRFYRNIASGKAIFTRGQKISLLLLFLYIVSIYAILITASAADSLASKKPDRGALFISTIFPFLWPVFLWTFVTVKGLSPAPQRKKRRRSYRISIATRR